MEWKIRFLPALTKLTRNPIRANLDYCLFLADLNNRGGHIYLNGWACIRNSDNECTDELQVRVESGGSQIASFKCDAERLDVHTAYPDAPEMCGFEAYIPVSDRTCLTRPVALFASVDYQQISVGSRTIFDVEQLLGLPKLKDTLTSRQRRKIENLILNERERIHKEHFLKSKPLYVSLDPSFSCQLNCPFCHADMLRESGMSLPGLSDHILDEILDRYGDTLVQLFFFLRGEPLLNTRFSSLVKKAHDAGIWTATSSNLSLQLGDERLVSLVESGLDLLIVSVDGGSEATYSQYRIGGDFKLVVDNLRRLAEIKQRLGVKTPVLRWQYLIFPWNEHEVETAKQIAAGNRRG